MNIKAEVKKDIQAMVDTGLETLKKGFWNKFETEDFDEYESMGIEEISDMMLSLYN